MTAACRCRAWRPTRRAWRSPADRSATAWRSPSDSASGSSARSRDSFVYCLFSDGELGEGSVWEGGLVGQPLEARQPDRHRRRQQPAGGRAGFPGHGLRAARGDASRRSAGTSSGSTATTSMPWSRRSTPPGNLTEPKPRIIICDTKMAKGVPFLEERETQPLPAGRAARMAEGPRTA